ncbi:MAG: hypothetical protein GY832_44700 [Chloroflexi bacterium]|nr:hypothetical protein [Chloroflexota bacterium]
MNTKIRLILIVALLGISAVVLAVIFMQRGGTPAPATTPSLATEPSGTTDIAAAPGATAPPDETAAPATPEATAATTSPPDGATIEPGAPVATPEPTPALRAEELLARELIQPRGQVTFSDDECSRILETESSCSVIKSAAPIIRPEWEELFPQTNFFLVKTNLHSYDEFAGQPKWLIVEYDGQHYTSETFDRLLKANGVTITDENRELVAKAFALMTIPDYLEEEVIFTEWEVGEWDSGLFMYTNYLKAWTKIQGLEILWWFAFNDNRLKAATRFRVVESHIGDYIDVSPFDLPLPLTQHYYFRGE